MIRSLLRKLRNRMTRPPAPTMPGAAASNDLLSDPSYRERIERENRIFAEQVNVHDLPQIFHYWSNKYLRPKIEAFGFSHPEDFFAKFLLEAGQRATGRPARFISVGSGNCDAEVRVAQDLRKRGLAQFTIECLEINPAMRARGLALAREHGVAAHIAVVDGDFNGWRPAHSYDAVLANQSLHHVTNLEDLFDQIHGALEPHGLFVTSDMIGRNGHRRWPEAMSLVREYWRELPPEYRFNLQLRRQEDEYQDWDCSTEGFEGVRAQDVLPLMLERFGFELFIGFGNIIDPFIDRSFGHHFNHQASWDLDFIDRVHARDEAEIDAGRIKPTHMLAVASRDRAARTRHPGHWSPAFCVRPD